MSHPDENDLPDSAIKAMWDEGDPVELADRASSWVEITPSPWSLTITNTTVRGLIRYFADFGGASSASSMPA